MRVFGVFSGIGGFELGLQQAGHEIVGMCEIDPFCRRVLRKHWPHTHLYRDVHEVDGTEIEADIICGGFPCQPFSAAARGRNRGKDDRRFLWPEMFRIISEVRPTWVISENVDRLEKMALAQVVSDLEGEGYHVVVFEIPACAVGLDHRRTRLWILGHSDRKSKSRGKVHAEVARMSWAYNDSRGVGASDGISGRMDRHRMRALGNAIVPEIARIIGETIGMVE